MFRNFLKMSKFPQRLPKVSNKYRKPPRRHSSKNAAPPVQKTVSSTNYMERSNPPGKKREVGALKRNRKEQMPVEDQIRASVEVAQAIGADVFDQDDDPYGLYGTKSDIHEEKLPPFFVNKKKRNKPPPPSSFCATLDAVACEIDDPLQKRMKDEKWEENSELENKADDGEQPKSGEAVISRTTSADIRPRDYSQLEKRQYRDTEFAEIQQNEIALFESVCNTISSQSNKSVEEVKAMLAQNVYGQASITMEDFSVANLTKGYPVRSNLRCRYDHHRFTNIPILLPLRFYERKGIVVFASNVVFCSFSCALAHIERDMCKLHASARTQRRQLLSLVARRYFGVTQSIQPAPLLEQHEDYGGALTTKQFRSFATSHFSFVQEPTSVSVPARYVTEFLLYKRVDRAKRQGLHLRVEEQHTNTVPSEPENPDARVDDGNGKRKRRERVATNSSGQRVVVDRSYVDRAIERATERRKKQPAAKHSLQMMMNIREVTYKS